MFTFDIVMIWCVTAEIDPPRSLTFSNMSKQVHNVFDTFTVSLLLVKVTTPSLFIYAKSPFQEEMLNLLPTGVFGYLGWLTSTHTYYTAVGVSVTDFFAHRILGLSSLSINRSTSLRVMRKTVICLQKIS